MDFETSHEELVANIPKKSTFESDPQELRVDTSDIETNAAGNRLDAEAEMQIISDEQRANRIASAIRSGSTGSHLKEVIKRTVAAVFAGTAMSHAEAVTTTHESSNAPNTSGRQEQRAEQKSVEFRGVASHPELGRFNIEISNLGAKQDGSFGYEYRVVMNNQQREVKFFQKMRNGAIYVELDGGETIKIPPAYGNGSERLPALTLVRDGKNIEIEITIQRR